MLRPQRDIHFPEQLLAKLTGGNFEPRVEARRRGNCVRSGRKQFSLALASRRRQRLYEKWARVICCVNRGFQVRLLIQLPACLLFAAARFAKQTKIRMLGLEVVSFCYKWIGSVPRALLLPGPSFTPNHCVPAVLCIATHTEAVIISYGLFLI